MTKENPTEPTSLQTEVELEQHRISEIIQRNLRMILAERGTSMRKLAGRDHAKFSGRLTNGNPTLKSLAELSIRLSIPVSKLLEGI